MTILFPLSHFCFTLHAGLAGCPLDHIANLPVDWGMLVSWLKNRKEAKARAAREAELLFHFMSDKAWQRAYMRAKDLTLPQEERVRAVAERWEIEQRLSLLHPGDR
ncbi:MAG: hypothetical protein WCE69_14580 [Aestuariivirga sp.]